MLLKDNLKNTKTEYPTVVTKVPYGHGLFCKQDISEGTVLEKFEGPVVDYNTLSDYDKTYVLNFLDRQSGEWKWLMPMSNARFANHSCSPNSFINDNLELVSRVALSMGDEITFVYNNGDELADFWDPVWNFKCGCASENCQGMIDRYRKFTETHK